MKLREQTLRRLVREEINFLKEEKRIIQEIDMSFFDWVIGGVGIELGRYLFQFVLTLGVVALSGLALSIKTFIQTHRRLKRERNSPVAKRVQAWLVKHPVFKDLNKFAKEAEEIQRELRRINNKDRTDNSEYDVALRLGGKFVWVKDRRDKIISQITEDAEKELYPEEIKYLRQKLFGIRMRT